MSDQQFNAGKLVEISRWFVIVYASNGYLQLPGNVALLQPYAHAQHRECQLHNLHIIPPLLGRPLLHHYFGILACLGVHAQRHTVNSNLSVIDVHVVNDKVSLLLLPSACH